jgi:nucleolar protein 56
MEHSRTLMAELAIYSTEAGIILLRDREAIAAEKSSSQLIARAKQMGASSVVVSDEPLLAAAREAGLTASLMRPEERETLDADKIGLIVRARLAPDEATALEIIRQQSIAAAEAAIREASSRPDLHLVQAIQALDDTDKFLNTTATRVSEWYGLHFPELTQMMEDKVALCRMVEDVGRRDGFNESNLKGRGMTDKKIEAVLTARDRSKGGEISDADLVRAKSLAHLALDLGSERDKLNTYVESAMRRIAPNVTDVAGATIGARLMAKAGGLDKLAVMPASTIQILGAEKALFRALRTGARPPKHGILFQHQEVHTAPKWQRGKIARTLANKIAIAARIDYYRGTEDTSVKAGLDQRLLQIKEKYKEAPQRKPEREETRKWQERKGGERRFRPGKRGRFDKKQKQGRR